MATSRPCRVDIPPSLEPTDEWKKQLIQRIANALEFNAGQIIEGKTKFSRFHEEFGGIGAQAVREYEEAARKIMKLARDTYEMEEAREQHRCIDERRKALCAPESDEEIVVQQLGKACNVRRMISEENVARASKQSYRAPPVKASRPTKSASRVSSRKASLEPREEVVARQKEDEFLTRARESRQERERELIRAVVTTVKEQELELGRLRNAMTEMAVKMDFLLEEFSDQRAQRRYQTVKVPDYELIERSNVNRRLDEIFVNEHSQSAPPSRSPSKSLKHVPNFHRDDKRP